MTGIDARILLALLFATPNLMAAEVNLSPPAWNVQLKAGTQQSQEFDLSTGSAPVERLDVAFTIDLTGSMGGVINVVKAQAASILSQIRQQVPDSRFAVAGFMDYNGTYSYPGYQDVYGSGSDVPWILFQDLTFDEDAATKALSSLSLGNGEDWPECYTRVIYECTRRPWREDAKRIVIVFGDAPTHDLDFAGFNFGGDPGPDGIAGTADDLDFETVVNQARAAGIIILGVDASGDAWSMPTFEGMSVGYGSLSGTGGQYVLLSDVQQIPSIVGTLLTSESLTLHHLSLECTSTYSSWMTVDPAEYLEVGPDQTLKFQVVMKVPEGTAPGEYAFAIRAIGDGALVASAVVDILVPSEKTTTEIAFRPSPDAFGFKNETSTATWTMFREFFGPSSVEYPNGDHLFAADDFYEKTYKPSGNGGSCDGFSVASYLSYSAAKQPFAGDFAMPAVSKLSDQGRQAQYESAVTFYQAAQQSRAVASIRSKSQALGPLGMLSSVKAAIAANTTGIIAIFHDEGGKRGGHALLPYRIEEENGVAQVFVYDCNYPGEDTRSIEVDLNANTWSYRFQDPFFWFFGEEIWSGDASDKSISFEPVSIYVDEGVPFWKTVSATDGSQLVISAVGTGILSVGVDNQGFVEDPLPYNQQVPGIIPLIPSSGWNPLLIAESYAVSDAHQYSVSYKTSAAENSKVSVVGTGFADLVESTAPEGLGIIVSDAGQTLNVLTPSAGVVDVSLDRDLDVQGREAKFEFNSAAGGAWLLNADRQGGNVAISGLTSGTTYNLNLRTRGSAVAEIAIADLPLAKGESHFFNFDWTDLGNPSWSIGVDEDGDGRPDRQIVGVSAVATVDPTRIDATSKGQFITAYIQLPVQYRNATFLPESIRLDGALATVGPSGLDDINKDGVPELMVKFQRAAVITRFGLGTHQVVLSGTAHNGSDEVRFEAEVTLLIK